MQRSGALVADRFASTRDGRVLDIATASHVTLSVGAAGSASEQRAWSASCDRWYRTRHPDVASLVDYGLVGPAHRFEAWAPAGSQQIPVAIASRDPTVEGAADDRPTIVLVERNSVLAIGEMLTVPCDARPRIAVLWGQPGSGRREAVLSLARVARLTGLVPIDSRLLQPWQESLRDRTLFIVDWTTRHAACAEWLVAVSSTPRPHVCLVVADHEVCTLDGVALEPLPIERLIAAVRPTPMQSTVAVRRAALRSGGQPGLFAGALWAGRAPKPRESPPARVAEQSAVYDSETSVALPPAPPSPLIPLNPLNPLNNDRRASDVWPQPAELSALRDRVASAAALIANRRFARGARLLRQTVAALARRHAWSDAARSSMMLAEALLGRGRARQAQQVLRDARTWLSHRNNEGPENTWQAAIVDVALLEGEAWTDLARFDHAERVLSAAMTSARAQGDSTRAGRAAIAMARCLFWNGRYADAAATLADLVPKPSDSLTAVRMLRHLARIEVAQGHVVDAMSALAEARNRVTDASGDESVRLRAALAHSTALIYLILGDLDAAEREASAATRLAVQSGLPRRVALSRFLEALVRKRGGTALARPVARSLDRLAKTMPPLVSARWVLAMAAAAPDDVDVDVERLEALPARLGIPALALLTTPHPQSPAVRTDESIVREAIAVIQIGYMAEDEAAVLGRICERLRKDLAAAGVSFTGVVKGPPRSYETLTCAGKSAGRSIDCHIAARAIEAGVAIGPHQVQGRIEAAAPVQYAGAILGALCARWTLGSTANVSRVSGVLCTAAAVAAPCVSALLAARDRSVDPTSSADPIGITSVMRDIRASIERAAHAPFAVLILGESGAGKEVVARAIHRHGLRRSRPFCTLNCAALPDELVESELFGHAKGAFTGAAADRAGIFEEASGGTLFLDEIGELSPRAQAKLLRVIQEGELRRIGENVARHVDVRIVSATNRDLAQDVERGRFRLDLFYRLDVIRIIVPPLRERIEDISLLVDRFWAAASRSVGSRAVLSAATQAVLAQYHWPGNVRELQNVLAALAVRAPRRGVVAPAALPPHLQRGDPSGVERSLDYRLDTARRAFEAAFVRAALARTGGQRTRAAIELGVSRQGLNKLMARLGIH